MDLLVMVSTLYLVYFMISELDKNNLWPESEVVAYGTCTPLLNVFVIDKFVRILTNVTIIKVLDLLTGQFYYFIWWIYSKTK